MAKIYQLPRFDSEPVREMAEAGTEITYADALNILATRADEWHQTIYSILDKGHYLDDENGKAHVVVDADILDSCVQDLHGLSLNLAQMARLIDKA